MIINIVETGGIYCYKKDNNILYIGKTKNNFNIRNQEHRTTNVPTEFETILQQDNNISYDIMMYSKEEVEKLPIVILGVARKKVSDID